LSPAALFGGFEITTMNTKNEIVTLSLSVRLEYETEAGREYLIRRLGEEVAIDMGGGGDVGFYSMKSVDGTARVKPNDEMRDRSGSGTSQTQPISKPQ